ncbi:E3 ubiquitin-protein ligase [Musa troglodytarum]|uniref:RING-type E3 ubiquitin transferase n=1 Tax=Musa troglodytarum TaxID=320322 RepID=A0A9E7EH28_9LILI|nr:E3 ubiquitin-protein ligase [Musa troglodytarum]
MLMYYEIKGLKVRKGMLECVVCLSDFKDDKKFRILFRCSYVFHLDYIDAWLTSHITCLICCANLIEQAANDNLNLLSTNVISLQLETAAPP